MADFQLQALSRQVYSLELRIRVINYSLMNVDLATANLQLQINKLRNIQVGLRSQATARVFSHLTILPFSANLVFKQEQIIPYHL